MSQSLYVEVERLLGGVVKKAKRVSNIRDCKTYVIGVRDLLTMIRIALLG